MKRILTFTFIMLMLVALLCTSALADGATCGRQKVNVIGDGTVTTDVTDADIVDYLSSLTDGDKDTGMKTVTSSNEQFPVKIGFSGSGKLLEEVIIYLQSETSNGSASGDSTYANIPYGQRGRTLTVRIYPVDQTDIKTVSFANTTAKEFKIDLSDFGKSVAMIEIYIDAKGITGGALWEIEANQYVGNHAWTLSSTIEPETCQKEGKGTYTCSCGATMEGAIPKKQHTLTWKLDNTTGEHYQTCATCTDEFNRGEHTYDNPCDELCNDCNRPRVVEPHTYRAPCATVCEKCGGAQRTPETTVHLYYANAACDQLCELCLEERQTTVAHTWDNACDTTCNVCTSTREVPDHIYTNDSECDEFCDECNARRATTKTHVYTNGADCDPACDICNTERQTSVDHEYANRCDPTCNECGFKRTQETDNQYLPNHAYDNPCDEECNFCKQKRTAEHEYLTECDRDCENCGYQRPANHVYSNKEGVVTLPATEKGEGIRTITCDFCGHTEQQTIPRLPKKDNTPLIIAIVVSVVVVLGCTAIALYSLVFKKRADEKKRRLQEYLKAQEEAQKAQEAEEEDDDDDTPIVSAFGGSMYDDSDDSSSTTSAFTGIGIGSFQGIGEQPAEDDDDDENTDTSDDETEE